MLEYLTQFSEQIISKTHEMQQQVNALVHESKVNS